MIGEILQTNHTHIYKANKIYDKIKEKEFGSFVLSIAGESGGGKSEIATLLREYLYRDGVKSRIESTDDYYKIHPLKRRQERQDTGIIGFQELDLEKLNGIVYSYKSKYPVHRKSHSYVYNRFTESYEYIEWDSRQTDCLIVEGLYSLYVKGVDFGIYLEGSNDQTKSFRKKRGKEDPDDPFRQQVLLKESEDIKKSKDNADLVIDYEGNVRN